jgi:hypothetical protein
MISRERILTRFEPRGSGKVYRGPGKEYREPGGILGLGRGTVVPRIAGA